jgi:gas vesicle protein
MERDYRSSMNPGQPYASSSDPQQFAQASRPWSEAAASGAACATGSTLATAMGVVTGAALGAAAMYLLDPDKGPDRRHHLADVAHDTLETTTDTLRDTWGVLGKGAGRVGSSIGEHFGQAASSAAAARPSRRQMSRRGHRFMKNLRRGGSSSASSLSDTAGDWLDSAKSYLPRRPSHLWRRPQLARPSDVSATTATLSGVAALAIGVGAMWLFDPRQGRGRRAWIGQKATRALNETGDFMRATGRHLRNKAKGYYYETASAAREGVSSLTGGPRSSGEESSAQNTLPRSTEEVAVTYGVIASPATPGENCPPGTTGTTGAEI